MKGRPSKYRNVVETLRNEILGGKYASYAPFPSVSMIVRRFGISNLTAVKVLAQLKDEGFVCSFQGRGTFVTKSAANLRKIGLIVPGIAYSEFYPPLVSDLSRLCQSAGYALLFGDVYSSQPSVRATQALALAKSYVEQGVAGVVYQPIEFLSKAEEVNGRILSVFDKAGIPVVLLAYDITFGKRSGHDVVGVNDTTAGLMLGEYLKGRGARDIHFVLRPRWSPSGAARLCGVGASVWDAGKCNWMKRNVLRANPDDLAAVRAHLRASPNADAFVCGCDEDALLLCRTLAKLGRRVPDDVLLAGFDDIRYATVMTPHLTTIRPPYEEIASMAFRTLLERVRDNSLPPREIYLPATLIERESTLRSGADSKNPSRTKRKGKTKSC